MDDAKPRSVRQILRRFYRRDPGMSHQALPVVDTVASVLARTLIAAVAGALLAIFTAPSSVMVPILFTTTLSQHVEGVRHRWWAAGAGLAAGLAVGLPLRFGLAGWGHWATFFALLAGGPAGILAHAAVTRVRATPETASSQ